MFLIDILRRSSRSLLSAKTRTLLTALAIAVGAFALTLTLGASNGAQQYADSIIKDNFDPSELIVTADSSLFGTDNSKPQVYDSSFGSITSGAGTTEQIKVLSDKDIERLKALPGVTAIRPAVSLNLQYLTRDGQKKYVGTALGYNSYKDPALLAGKIPTTLSDHSLILPQGFLSALGFSSPQDAVGKPVRLAVRQQFDQKTILAALLSGTTDLGNSENKLGKTIEEEFTIVAVAKTPSTLVQPGSALFLTIDTASLTKLNDYATAGTSSYHNYISANLKVTDGDNAAKLSSVQRAVKKLGYGAQSVVDTQKTITQVISVLQGIVSVFGLIAVVASVFGVVNTMYISVLQRTREIGLMKALGMHKKDVNRLFLFEAALIGFLGGTLGALLAVALGTLGNPALSRQLSIGDINLIIFKPAQIGLLILVLTLVAVFAGLLPARKASRLDPIDALRTE